MEPLKKWKLTKKLTLKKWKLGTEEMETDMKKWKLTLKKWSSDIKEMHLTPTDIKRNGD